MNSYTGRRIDIPFNIPPKYTLMALKVINESTTMSAIAYQVDANGRKSGYYRESIWNALPKFVFFYKGDSGMQQVLRAPDVVAEYTYRDDVLHGRYTITRQLNDDWERDKVRMIRSRIEGEYVNGKKSGFEREYSYVRSPKGHLTREAHYKDGKLDGYTRRFDANGCLIYSAQFVDGVRNGTETSYTPDGGITRLDTWSKGRKIIA